MNLRPATELKAENIRRSKQFQDRSHDAGMVTATKAIEDAHKAGKTEVCCLTFSDSVVYELRTNGYTVKHYPAASCGDMDSHIISWI